MSPATLTPDRRRFRVVLAEMAEKARATLPECNGRVDSAVKIVLAGDIDYTGGSGSAVVHSCSDPQRVYHIQGTHCDCLDYAAAPRHYCKHRLPLALLIRVHAVLESEAPPAFQATGQEVETSQPLPEAPSSVNLKVHDLEG
jgi:hypothetical protein